MKFNDILENGLVFWIIFVEEHLWKCLKLLNSEKNLDIHKYAIVFEVQFQCNLYNVLAS